MDKNTIELLGMLIVVIFVVLFFCRDDIVMITIKKNQTLRTFFNGLSQDQIASLKLKTIVDYFPSRKLTTEEQADIKTGIFLRIPFWGVAALFFLLLKAFDFYSFTAECLSKIRWVNLNMHKSSLESLFVAISVVLLFSVSTFIGSKYVAIKRMLNLKNAAMEIGTSMFEYARSHSSKHAINHIEEHLDNPRLIKTYIDMYMESGHITEQSAETLKAVYLSNNRYFIKLRRWQVAFRTLGISIVFAFILLLVYVYIIMPFV